MKKYFFLLFLFLLPGHFLFAHEKVKDVFPHEVISLQFAGSVGFFSGGYWRASKKENIGLGLIYGYTPQVFGGPLHSLSFKFLYSPFKVHFLHHFCFEPLQAGVFIAQNFGKNLYLTWPDKYPKHYYWWSNSLREHVFVSSQMSYYLPGKTFEKVSLYFEANTNDLYIYSYFPNRGAIRLYDIIFFGIGIKAGFH